MSASQDRLEPRPAAARNRFSRIGTEGILILRFRLGQTDDALAFFELTAFLQEFDALEPFQHTALCLDSAFSFQTGMLAHKLDGGGEWTRQPGNATAFWWEFPKFAEKFSSGLFPWGVVRSGNSVIQTKMTARFFLILLAATTMLTGCATSGKKTPPKPGEADFRKLEVAGVKLGDTKSVLRRFGSAKKSSLSGGDREVYEIYKPNPYISMLVLTFQDGRVRKMELRYFNGPTEHTLTSAGGWDGLRDYLVKRFGPPTRTGAAVPQLTDMRGLNAAYSKFNGEWIFPKAQRRIHYIALADAKGGVGTITFLDTSPRTTAPAGTANNTGSNPNGGPNPGF